MGLFGHAGGATIENLEVRGTIETSFNGNIIAGGIIGLIESPCTLSQCKVDITVDIPDVGSAYEVIVGGLIGSSSGFKSGSTINNCYTTGTISSTAITTFAGGLVGGYLVNTATPLTITNSYSTVVIDVAVNPTSVEDYVAGIIGNSWYSGVSTVVRLNNVASLASSIRAGGNTKRVWCRYGAVGSAYANVAMTVNGVTVSSTNAADRNGANVAASLFNTQAWYQNTLGWNFTSIWEWDSTTQLPTLQVFKESAPIVTDASVSPSTGIVGTQFSLSATVTNYTSIQWQRQSSGSSTWTNIPGATSLNATYTPTTSGTYNIRIQATNSVGTTTVNAGSITVTIPLPVITSAGANPTTIHVGESTTFSAVVSGQTSLQWQYYANVAGSTWQWVNLTGGTTNPFTLTLNSVATNQYRLQATNSSGSVNSATFTVTVEALPLPEVVNIDVEPVIGPIGTTFYFSADVEYGVTYQWQISDDGTTWTNLTGRTSLNGSYTGSTVGTYWLRIKATNSTGTTTSQSTSFEVVAQYITIYAPNNAQTGESVAIDIEASGIVGDPVVNFGDGSPEQAGWAFDHVYTTPGNFEITATGTTSSGSVIDSHTIIIITYGQVTLTVDDNAVSLTGTVNLTSSYTGSETPYIELKHSLDQISWTTFTNAASSPYTFADTVATSHYFKAVYTTPVQGVIESSVVIVNTEAVGVSILTPVNNSTVFVGYAITITATPIGLTSPTYSWNTGERTATITKTYNTAGGRTLTVTATSSEGTFTASVTIFAINTEDIVVSAPSQFSNGVAWNASATAPTQQPTVTWTLADGVVKTGASITHTFTGYSMGEMAANNISAIFTDGQGNTYTTQTGFRMTCVFTPSFYENSRGEKFYFDDNCVMLRDGKSGFSEIQVNTSVMSGHDFAVVNGLDYNNRVLMFNVFVKGARAQMHAIRRQMVHIMAPTKTLGTFSFTRDDGEVFTIRCNIALGYPSFTDEALEAGWIGTISFIAPEGLWEGAEVTQEASSIVNEGDVPCGFRAELGGNLMNATNGEQITALTGSLVGTTIDTEAGTISTGWSNISLNSTLVKLEVGQNSLTGTRSVTYKPKFLGV
jgi:hypothetical protein